MINFNLLICLVAVIFYLVPLGLATFCNNDKVKSVVYKILSPLFLGIVGILTLTEVKFVGNDLVFNFTATGNASKNFFSNFMKFNSSDFKINVLMLSPLGSLRHLEYSIGENKKMTTKNKLIRATLDALCLSAFIETMQMVLPINRVPDINDILLNTISGFAGIASCETINFVSHKLKDKIIAKRVMQEAKEKTKTLENENQNTLVGADVRVSTKINGNTSSLVERLDSIQKVVEYDPVTDFAKQKANKINDVLNNTTKSLQSTTKNLQKAMTSQNEKDVEDENEDVLTN